MADGEVTADDGPRLRGAEDAPLTSEPVPGTGESRRVPLGALGGTGAPIGDPGAFDPFGGLPSPGSLDLEEPHEEDLLRALPGQDSGVFGTEVVGQTRDFPGGPTSDIVTRTRPLRPSEPVSITQMRASWWSMDRMARANWQQRMVDAGFMDEPPVWGLPMPDNSDYEAWISLATQSARLRLPMDEMLGEMIRNRPPEEGEKGPRRPDTRVTNTADARRLAEELGQELIGRKPNEEEISRAVARLRSLEVSHGSAAADAAMAEAGGNVVEGAPSPQTALADSIEQQVPEEVRAHETTKVFADFLGMLGGGA